MNASVECLNAQEIHGRIDAVRYYLDRRTLEAHLTSLLDAARLEQARGVLAGAPVYAVLHRQAAEQVRDHCRRWQFDPPQIEGDLPAITELRRLSMRAVSASTSRSASWLLTIGLAALAISVALTSD